MVLHQVKVKCHIQNEEGELIPTATSIIVRRAATFGDAETEVFKHFLANNIKSFAVKGIGILNVDEVQKHIEDGDEALTWFKIKTRYGVEGSKKKMTNVTLIQHYTMDSAHARLRELFANTSYDLEFTNSSEVAIMDYIELPEAEKTEEDQTIGNLPTGPTVQNSGSDDEEDDFFDEEEEETEETEDENVAGETEKEETEEDDDDFDDEDF